MTLRFIEFQHKHTNLVRKDFKVQKQPFLNDVLDICISETLTFTLFCAHPSHRCNIILTVRLPKSFFLSQFFYRRSTRPQILFTQMTNVLYDTFLWVNSTYVFANRNIKHNQLVWIRESAIENVT